MPDLCYHLRAKITARPRRTHEGGPVAEWYNLACPDCPAFANFPYTPPPVPVIPPWIFQKEG